MKKNCSWHIYQNSYPEKTGELWWTELLERLGRFCEELDIPVEDRKCIRTMFRDKVMYHPYRLYEDAEEMLTYCREQGFENYLLTNNYPELEAVVERLGLRHYFTDLFISSQIGFDKPRRELFDYALKRAQNPECCYMIGDNPVADMKGGKDAGMRTILVHTKNTAGYADEVCRQLMEIREILQRDVRSDDQDGKRIDETAIPPDKTAVQPVEI